MKIPCFVISALFFGSLAQAQKTKPGIAILTSGDTLKGNLSISAFERYGCELNAVKYTPEQVNSFYVPGEAYFEKIVINDDEVFAALLVSGRVDLFERKGSYYLRDESNKLVLLESVKQTRIVNNKEYAVINDKYKSVLREYFVDCPTALTNIEASSLSRRALTGLFNDYNECFGINSTSSSVTLMEQKSRWYVGAGYNIIESKLKGIPTGWRYSNSNFYDETSQGSATFFLQYNPGALKGLSVQLSGYSSSFEYHSNRTIDLPESTGTGYVFKPYNYKYNLSYNSFILPLMIQYSFFGSRMLQPYVGLGTALHFASKFSGEETVTDPSNKQYHNPLHDITKSDASLLRAQLGVNLKLNAFLIGTGITYDYMHSPLGFTGVLNGKFTGYQADLVVNLSAAFAFAR